MSVARPSWRQALRAAAAASMLAAGSVLPASAAGRPVLHTSRGCYSVGQPVQLTGTGFAPGRTFDLADDGVDFGESVTDSSGGFSVSFRPGGLPAGVAQHVSHLNATDGSSSGGATFTLTRRTGALLRTTGGNPHTLAARFEAWGFALDGSRPRVYLHWVAPSGQARLTVALGRAGGQCGYLLTRKRRVFPFAPTVGGWVLQLDTRLSYVRTPGGPVVRIAVQIS